MGLHDSIATQSLRWSWVLTKRKPMEDLMKKLFPNQCYVEVEKVMQSPKLPSYYMSKGSLCGLKCVCVCVWERERERDGRKALRRRELFSWNEEGPNQILRMVVRKDYFLQVYKETQLPSHIFILSHLVDYLTKFRSNERVSNTKIDVFIEIHAMTPRWHAYDNNS